MQANGRNLEGHLNQFGSGGSKGPVIILLNYRNCNFNIIKITKNRGRLPPNPALSQPSSRVPTSSFNFHQFDFIRVHCTINNTAAISYLDCLVSHCKQLNLREQLNTDYSNAESTCSVVLICYVFKNVSFSLYKQIVHNVSVIYNIFAEIEYTNHAENQLAFW